MKTFALKDLETSELRESEQLLIDMLRTKYPHLDLRLGTALRDLLVVPDAIVHAWFSKQADEQRAVSSLQELLARADAGEEIDTDDVNRVLSNFNLSGTAGTSASGVVRIVVSSARTYTVVAGDRFETIDGLVFEASSTVTAEETPIAGEVKLFKGTANWYFFVPVSCTTVGTAGNITRGTVLGSVNSFAGFVSATAYGDFSGGADVENLHALVSRIPAALSTRGLLTETAAEAVLRDRFDTTDNPIVAVSTVGYGNDAQLRDKHNPFGIGVGGRVDVYVRNFTAPNVVSVTKTCTLDSATGDYVCTISASEAPGMQGIQYVSDPDASATGSYSYGVTFGGESLDGTWHDFDVSGGYTELAGTVWRSCEIRITNTGGTNATREFGIGVICLPGISAIQTYVDDPSVRNAGSDFVVRCPNVCRVTIDASCRYRYGMTFDVDAAKKAVADYVNTTGFIGRLTRSEIACVLKANGATSVDIVSDYMLTGTVIDAKGVSHSLFGDSLDIDEIRDPSAMLTKDTCVFSTAVENINLTATPE